jgi:hypothetical protein
LFVAILFSAGSQLLGQLAFSPRDESGNTMVAFDRIQRAYQHRRAEKLREVDSWHRSQLEALSESLPSTSPAAKALVTDALKSAREEYWQDDQPELRDALLATAWLWCSEDDQTGVTVTFQASGSVEHPGMHGAWRITGPSEVTIHTDEDETFILRFNASLSRYEAQYRNVSGHRLARPRGT